MKKKLFAVITIILILTAAYWYGGSSDNSHGWLIRDDNSPASEQYVSGAGSGADMQTDSNESEAVQGAAQADIDQESNVIPDDNIDGTDARENYKVNNTGSDGAGTDKAESTAIINGFVKFSFIHFSVHSMLFALTGFSKSPITFILSAFANNFFNLYPTSGPKASPVILSVPIHTNKIFE